MKTLQALLMALVLIPCNAADKARKQEGQIQQQAVSAHSIDEAIAKSQPVALAPGKKVKRPITLKNPILEIEGQRVAYDVYSMQGHSGKPFHLTVWSYCNCFGFDKTIIVPQIVVLSNGKLVPTEAKSEGKPAAGLTPMHYLTTLTGTFDSDGTAQILLFGDPGGVGSTVTTIDGGAVYVASVGTSIDVGTFAITKSPIGTIAIELQAD